MQIEQLELLSDYKTYLYQLGYKKQVQKSMLRKIKEFLQYLASIDFKNIIQQDISDFFEYLEQRPLQIRRHKNTIGTLQPSTIYGYATALKIFFAWLEETEQIYENPISSMVFKRPEQNIRQPLTQSQIQDLFNATENIKQRIILHLFYSCGLRRNEAVQLDIKDVQFNKCMLYVRNGKGSKRRAIPITKSVAKDFETYYQDKRKQYENKTCNAFILNNYQTRMQGDSYSLIFRNLLKKAAIQVTVRGVEPNLHHLRHSIATHLLENGLSIKYVQEFLGHIAIDTTQIYTKVNTNQLYQLMKQ
jgi:integrase/recombinase XerD